MVGFRVFDVGLLLLWLVWFFRMRDDDDDDQSDEGGGPGGGGQGPKPYDGSGGGGGLRKRFDPGPRIRNGFQPRKAIRPRGAEPLPSLMPARVRQPRTPDPARRT